MLQHQQQICDEAQNTMGERGSLLSMWQEIADNFYVERADFTSCRGLGYDYAAHLTTSAPLNARRDLGNIFSTMLRPSDKDWAEMSTTRPDKLSQEDKRWLEWATKLQKNAMYDKNSGFARAMTESDHDVAAFGQSAISIEVDRKTMTLMYRCWHLKDMGWIMDVDGTHSIVVRNWNPAACVLEKLFKDQISPKVKELLANGKDRYKKINCRHIVVKSENYQNADGKAYRSPYVSIYVDLDNQFVMEETPINHAFYCIPKWQTLSGSSYALSPATMGALPDARLMQQMMLTILEAGQKAVDPPMVAVQEVVKNAELFAGGMSWLDADYHGDLGEALRPLTEDHSGLPFGLELYDMMGVAINNSMYLNKIALPLINGKMTAFETSQRVAEYVRQALPLFEPLETNYNGQVCDLTFQVLMAENAFGNPRDIPKTLLGQDINFRFTNPLRETAEKAKAGYIAEGLGLIGQIEALKPGSAGIVNTDKMLRDGLEGIGWSPEWTLSKDEFAAVQDEQAKKQEQANLLASLQQGADIAKTTSEAAQGFQQGAVV